MAYVTPDDVRQVLTPDGKVAPGKNTAAALSDEDLAIHVDEAQSQVDAALTASPTAYPVPFADGQVPVHVQRLTAHIAAYLATLQWHRGVLPLEHPDALRYTRATAMLEQLRTGAAEVPGFAATPGRVAPVTNFVPDEQSWHPDFGFGAGQQVPG